MEHVHGVDVSWMTHGSPKDKVTRTPQRRNTISSTDSHTSEAKPTSAPDPEPQLPSSPRPIPGTRPGSAGSDRLTNSAGTPPQPSPQRRGSWFSTISSKFSSNNNNNNNNNNGNHQSSPPPGTPPPKQSDPIVPRANPVKNAVLQHATRHEGDGPYTPAPPKTSQPGLLQVFRRLSSSGNGGGSLGSSGFNKKNHGLVERVVLNVDRDRERCTISDLNQSKLRRVAFCVDVEIAPLPKYAEPGAYPKKANVPASSAPNKKPAGGEKAAEGAAKSPGAAQTKGDEKEKTNPPATAESTLKSGEPNGEKVVAANGTDDSINGTNGTNGTNGAKDTTTSKGDASEEAAKVADAKKREKKKRSEEERKARKAKKRKQAELNGQVPMEISVDSDGDSSGSATADNNTAPRAQSVPTTNPVRIYRRCCQLRETPILKKITEQLSDPNNVTAGGVVDKLDLGGYWLHLSDLVTLGDYLAVVPVREVILENCGLNDEGMRVILAGLLAAKLQRKRGRKKADQPKEDSSTTDNNHNNHHHDGGVVERLVLRNNKIGPEGWKHLCLFIYMCRSLKQLDISCIPLPRTPSVNRANGGHWHLHHNHHHLHLHMTLSGSSRPPSPPPTTCQLLAKSLRSRLGGPTLELLNVAETAPEMEELGFLMDGIANCGIKRLGLAGNNIDSAGISHVARYLSSGVCVGLDLGGNDLRDQLEVLADSLSEDSPLSVLSVAECNLVPKSLCKLFPKLAKLPEFRFIDLSHNRDLFRTEPSCIPLLRRYLPKMPAMKRIHLADVSMNSEQAIALAEILPEVKGLAHISLLENPELSKLADAKTEEEQEEACAFYASMLAATRVSPSIVAVDMDVPTENSGEIVKALAKQVVAYCLQNMERLTLGTGGENASPGSNGDSTARQDAEYPFVLQHLVGDTETNGDLIDDYGVAAPDDDYVIGGTGVVKALACCLKNRGDESRRASGEFVRPGEAMTSEEQITSPASRPASPRRLRAGRAKVMSKHLLGSARNIRHRLQPAIAKAKLSSTNSAQDAYAYHRLLFLDKTLDGIIKRFEHEFPETRETRAGGAGEGASGAETATTTTTAASDGTAAHSPPLTGSFEAERTANGGLSDDEEEGVLVAHRPKAMSRSSSILSMTSKGLTEEEGRVLRAGHKFRASFTQEQFDLVSGEIDEIEQEPNHARMLVQLVEDLGNEELERKVAAKGVVAVFKEDREWIRQLMRQEDPEHWEKFVESQAMARANVKVGDKGALTPGEEVAVTD